MKLFTEFKKLVGGETPGPT